MFITDKAVLLLWFILTEPHRDKTNKVACAPSEDSDQPGHPPRLIRVFAVRMKKAWVLSYTMSAQRRLRSDWVDTQYDLSLRWAHMPFCWFCHDTTQWSLFVRFLLVFNLLCVLFKVARLSSVGKMLSSLGFPLAVFYFIPS